MNSLANTANLHLQIWRPTVDPNTFTLVWDKRVKVVLSYSTGALYVVSFQLHLTIQNTQLDLILKLKCLKQSLRNVNN